jgi:hypothetical protein
MSELPRTRRRKPGEQFLEMSNEWGMIRGDIIDCRRVSISERVEKGHAAMMIIRRRDFVTSRGDDSVRVYGSSQQRAD